MIISLNTNQCIASVKFQQTNGGRRKGTRITIWWCTYATRGFQRGYRQELGWWFQSAKTQLGWHNKEHWTCDCQRKQRQNAGVIKPIILTALTWARPWDGQHRPRPECWKWPARTWWHFQGEPLKTNWETCSPGGMSKKEKWHTILRWLYLGE